MTTPVTTRTVNANDLLVLFQTHRIRSNPMGVYELNDVQRNLNGTVTTSWGGGVPSEIRNGSEEFTVRIEPRIIIAPID